MADKSKKRYLQYIKDLNANIRVIEKAISKIDTTLRSDNKTELHLEQKEELQARRDKLKQTLAGMNKQLFLARKSRIAEGVRLGMPSLIRTNNATKEVEKLEKQFKKILSNPTSLAASEKQVIKLVNKIANQTVERFEPVFYEENRKRAPVFVRANNLYSKLRKQYDPVTKRHKIEDFEAHEVLNEPSATYYMPKKVIKQIAKPMMQNIRQMLGEKPIDEKEADKLKNRKDLTAECEVARITNRCAEHMAKQVGIKKWVWGSSGSLHPRAEHEILYGKTSLIGETPEPKGFFPGEAANCKCQMIFITDKSIL